MTRAEMLYEMGYEDVVVFEDYDYDSAIIGVSDDGRAIYDYDKMVEDLMITDGINMVDAMEYIDYNTLRAYSRTPERDPIVMYRLIEFD